MSSALVAVQARVAELQALLSPARAGAGKAAGTRPGASTASNDFGAAMLKVLNQADAARSAGGAGSATGTAAAPSGSDAAGRAGGAGPGVGDQAVALAKGYSGVPYLWGGTDPGKGLDCSGLTQLVYRKLGISIPRVSADQARAGTKVPSLAEARPGDLVFFGSPVHHVGIYAGDGTMVDAPRAGRTVGVHPLWSTPTAIRRFTPEPATAAASVAPSTAVPGPRGGSGLAGPYAALFTAAGRKHGVDPALLSAVAKAESSYNPSAVSPAGARGLMQLMPGTARSLGVDAYDPAQAVDGAARLLSQLTRQFDGRVDLALAGYNAGPGAVRRYGGIPPYAETQTYVQRVTRYWEALK